MNNDDMKNFANASSKPIGIFDSGIGGLTVAHAIAKRLPHENFIYFGDTAHLPYGDKSAATIQGYCEKIVDFLLGRDCKLIMIACNSASAAAFEHLQKYIDGRALLMSVIDPVVDYLAKTTCSKKIGLIGTRQTVNSGVFQKKISVLPNQLELKALATPLLVPIIEENFHEDNVLVDQALKHYLSSDALASLDMLILACTHYPVIKQRIAAFYQNTLPLLDASEISAHALAETLEKNHLLNTQIQKGTQTFFVSDLTPAFAQMANTFFGDDVALSLSS